MIRFVRENIVASEVWYEVLFLGLLAVFRTVRLFGS